MSSSTLLVVIPCLNEEKTIAHVIREIPRSIPGIGRVDVAVVDDGSTDATAELAQEAGAIVLKHSRNRGVGAAFRTGLRHARVNDYDYLVNMDGDGQFNPSTIPDILAPVLAGEADLVTGSRFKDKALIPKMPGIKRWGNFRIAGLVSMLTGQKFYDVSCGFRAYNKELIAELTLLGDFTYTHEALLQAAFKSFKIVEVPVEVRGEREFGKSRVASNLWLYAKRTSSIIGSTFVVYRPFQFFGLLSFICFAFGFALGFWFLYNRITTGSFEPHIWAGFTSAYTVSIGILSLLFGQASFLITEQYRILKSEMAILNAQIKKQQDPGSSKVHAPSETADNPRRA